ncbi:carboxymuconolactone decarboxylase family protein [Afipia carboxidovorans]|uniref:carboxymuconolactone decarboxylase family protein n=1 Tax=Afipia carboxidovorans TaxID=40137 RepID=UPI003085BDAF|nr:carboxymuconolactone decarboxylase family protein [Afipia carboxidovorans]
MSHRVEIKKVAPDAMKAFGPLDQYVGACGLDRALIDMLFMRISQINGCAYCVDLHWRDAMKAGDDARKFNSIITWREAPFFSERERAALNWAESLTLVADTGAPDADYEEMKAHFSEKEIADVTVVIALMNAMNRLGIGQRLAPAIKVVS